MPVIPIDDQGHSLYYEDTGAPPDTKGIYSTLMIVHGTGFHSQIFRRLIPLAPRHGLRLVLVNRRDYPGSSPYTEEDLEKIRGEIAELHNKFAMERALEFATFIRTFTEKENIPKASNDWKRGGIVLMAWSSGNAYTLSLLSYADAIPEATRQTIEPYLRSLIVFDAPRFLVGGPPSQDALRDLSLSEEERVRQFNIWVSSYYSHKSLTSRSPHDLLRAPDSDPSIRRSTFEAMTTEEIKETTFAPPSTGSELAFRSGSPSVFAERIRRALFDDSLAKRHLPHVEVNVVWGEKSIWVVVDSVWQLQRTREKVDDNGIKGRPLRFYMIPGANHFPHWDEPEMTMEFLANIIDA